MPGGADVAESEVDPEDNEVAIVTSYLGPSERPLASPCEISSSVSRDDDAGGGSELGDTALEVDEDGCDWRVSCQA